MTTAVANKPPAARRASPPMTAEGKSSSPIVGSWLGGVIVTAALCWSYWPTILSLLREWKNDPNYSVGQLVPFAAVYLTWHDRKHLAALRLRTCWWGLAILVMSQAFRATGVLYLYESMERYSLIVAVWGLVLLLTGSAITFSMRWILLFLVLMVPLPGKIHNLLSGPLQDLATVGAVFMLELLGVIVGREGHVLMLNDRVPVAVAEACSGLRMLTAFVVVDAVLTYVIARPLWQKTVMLAAAIPVAVVCNLIRLVATALLFLVVNAELAERFFHDFAGWTMMPLAIGMLFGLLWLLGRITLADKSPLTDR